MDEGHGQAWSCAAPRALPPNPLPSLPPAPLLPFRPACTCRPPRVMLWGNDPCGRSAGAWTLTAGRAGTRGRGCVGRRMAAPSWNLCGRAVGGVWGGYCAESRPLAACRAPHPPSAHPDARPALQPPHPTLRHTTSSRPAPCTMTGAERGGLDGGGEGRGGRRAQDWSARAGLAPPYPRGVWRVNSCQPPAQPPKAPTLPVIITPSPPCGPLARPRRPAPSSPTSDGD